jgi:hypothetical protein
MFRFHRSTIRLTATTLLVVFLSALLGPVVALARVQQLRECAEAGEHLHLPGMPQAHHHHEDDHHDQDEHPTPGLHAPKSHQPHHGCTTSDHQQLSSLTPLLKLLAGHSAPAVLALPPAQSFLFRPFQDWDRQQAVVLVPPEHLKPKIPDLRIFIGSLVI